MDNPLSNRKTGLILAMAGLGVIDFQTLPGPKPLDDAFITFRYARNLSQGAGFVYNPGERVQGTTTPAYTLILAGMAVLFGSEPLPVISFGIALAADILNVWLFYRIAKRVLKTEGLAFAAALVFLLQPLRLNAAAGGMETSLFILFILAMVDRYLAGRYLAMGVWMALALFTRIDAVLAAAPILLHLFFIQRKAALKTALLLAALLLPWFLWATWYFGSPIPQSLVAKHTTYLSSTTAPTWILLLTFLGTGTVGPYPDLFLVAPGLVLFLFLFIFGTRHLLRIGRTNLGLVSYPVLYYGVMGALGVPMFFIWYYPPLMPGFLLALFAALDHFAGRTHPLARIAMLSSTVMALLLVPLLLLNARPGWAITRESERLYQEACQAVEPLVQPGQVVLAPDIGVLGWCLDHAKILDPVGLVSPVSLEYTANRAPGELFSPSLLYHLTPDYVVSRLNFIKRLTQDPRFGEEYHLVWQGGEEASNGNPVMVFVHSRPVQGLP